MNLNNNNINKLFLQHLSLSEDDLQLVCVMKTGGVVAEAWGEEGKEGLVGVEVVGPEQLSSIEARAALLTTLISSTTTLTQAKALINLLHLWPPFNPQVSLSISDDCIYILCMCGYQKLFSTVIA